MNRKKRILVVDDEEELVEMIELALEKKGYEVFKAYDGQAGLIAASEKQPDLIVLDVILPKLNGYQICRELKGAERTKEIPVIFLTAKGQESDRFWGMETGAEDYLVKPFEMEDLIEKIGKNLK